METKVIDGQMVYIANVEWWELFIQTNKSKDIPIMLSASMSEWIQSHLDFARYYMELVIAVRFVGVLGWVPLFLLKIADGLQRVHLEKLLCEICGWQGMTANPLVSDLYSGVPDKQAALEATYKYSVLPVQSVEVSFQDIQFG